MVLGYGNMKVSWCQQYKLWPSCQGGHIRWLQKGCEPHLLTPQLCQPTFSPPPPPSWHFGLISATFSTIVSFSCSIEQRKCISRYHWVSSSICESLSETSLSATFQHDPYAGFTSDSSSNPIRLFRQNSSWRPSLASQDSHSYTSMW